VIEIMPGCVCLLDPARAEALAARLSRGANPLPKAFLGLMRINDRHLLTKDNASSSGQMEVFNAV
jgi:hypothetical protein